MSTELNGHASPYDLGMDALVRAGIASVGRDLLDRPALHEPVRPRLVGLRAANRKDRFLGGAQLTVTDTATEACGYVTSSAYSPHLGEWVGLGFVARNFAADGTRLIGRDPLRGGNVSVEVVSTIHLDRDGMRMKA